MRLNTEETTVVLTGSNVKPEEFELKDINLFISMYRDKIYKNKLRVIPQEYLSNARDAHREIGKTCPVKVSLPTEWDPVLRIRDYGLGMDSERIKVFKTYGDSTKRDTDDETGGFGIGCKCAWSKYDAFMVTTIFFDPNSNENVRREYHMYLDGPKSAGLIRLVNERTTSEPCGTEIIIPVKDAEISYINESVRAATLFWDIQPIVDEEQTKSGYDSFEIVEKQDGYVLFQQKPNIFGLRTSNGWVIVDGICYPLDKEVLVNGSTFYEDQPDGTVKPVTYSIEECYFKQINSGRLAFLFNTNEVSINPNREELEYDIKTFKSLKNRIEKFGDRAAALITNMIINTSSIWESFQKIRENNIFKDLLDPELEAHGVKLVKVYKLLNNREHIQVYTSGIKGHIKKFAKRDLYKGHDKCAVFCYKNKQVASCAATRMVETYGLEVLGVDRILVYWREDLYGSDLDQDEFQNLITYQKYKIPKTSKSSFISVGLYSIKKEINKVYFNKITISDLYNILESKRVFYCVTDRKFATIKNMQYTAYEINKIVELFLMHCGKWHNVIFLTSPGVRLLKKEGIDTPMFEDQIDFLYERLITRVAPKMLFARSFYTCSVSWASIANSALILDTAKEAKAPLEVLMDLKHIYRCLTAEMTELPHIRRLTKLGYDFPDSVFYKKKFDKVVNRIQNRYSLLDNLDDDVSKDKLKHYIECEELSKRMASNKEAGENYGS